MRKSHVHWPITAWVIFLLVVGSFFMGYLASLQAQTTDYPADPSTDIKWASSTESSVTDLQTRFNTARANDSTVKVTLTMPSQVEWDKKSDGEKALWLINQERIDRSLLPLSDLEPNVISVAQAYAQILLDKNAFGHTVDGLDPWKRLEANSTIKACHDFLGVAENIAVFWGNWNFPIERAVYNWIYDDSGSSWGHRHAVLWKSYNNNSGPVGNEGFLGIGHVNGTHSGYPKSDLIVLNVFDPCSTWNYDMLNLKQGNNPIANSTGNYDFGAVSVNKSSSAVEFTLTNVGTVDLNLTGTPKVVVAGATDFTVDETNTISPVAPSKSTTFKVTFKPSVAGARSATLTITSNDPNTPSYSFTVKGTGSESLSPTNTPTLTPTNTSPLTTTLTVTPTPSKTPIYVYDLTPTVTLTATITPTATSTTKVTVTPTKTPTAKATVTPIPAPKLNIRVQGASKQISPGQTLHFSLAYSNTGNLTATKVILSLSPPLYTTFDPANSTPGWALASTVNLQGGQLLAGQTYTFALGDLAPGQRGEVNFALPVQTDAPEGSTLSIEVGIRDSTSTGSQVLAKSNTAVEVISDAIRNYLPLIMR